MKIGILDGGSSRGAYAGQHHQDDRGFSAHRIDLRQARDSSVPLDAVRLYIGDTDASDQLVQDEVIAWALSQATNSVPLASARVARFIATKFSRDVDRAAGDTKEMLSQRAKNYLLLVRELDAQAGVGTGGGMAWPMIAPIVTGVSVAEIASVTLDPDRPGSFWPDSEIDPLDRPLLPAGYPA